MLNNGTTPPLSGEENSAHVENVEQVVAEQTHAQPSVQYTCFENIYSKTPLLSVVVCWPELIKFLTTTRFVTPSKNSVQLMSLALYTGTRNNENVDAVTAAIFDYDDGTPFETVRQRAIDLEFVAYSTHSNSREKQKFRMVIQLLRPVTRAEWDKIWPVMNARFGGSADKHAKDACRMSYLPSCPAEYEDIAFSYHNPGKPLDPDELLTVAAEAFTDAVGGNKGGKPDMNIGFSEGKRHGELTRRAGWLLGVDHKTEEETLQACLAWNELNTPPMPLKEVEKTVTDIAKKEKAKPRPPSGYRMSAEGLFFLKEDPDGKPIPVRLSGPFEICAETRDDTNNSWGIRLKWYDHDNKLHEWCMPRALLAGDGTEIYTQLLDGGLFVSQTPSTRAHLKTYLAIYKTEARARCVARIGWHGATFVMPDKSYGKSSGEETILQTIGKVPEFKITGSMQAWQRSVAAPAVGNNLLAFAISTAFAGPLLYLLDEESGGFHIIGPSSIGKSTALDAAASVWGSDSGTWRTTDNAAENLAVGASDGLLTLDEIGQAEAKCVDALCYLFANGQGKRRMKRDGTARAATTWRIIFISTGEVGLAEKIGEINKRLKAGQTVRIIELPADAGKGYGLFENLHGAESADAFSRQLKIASKENTGHAAIDYIEKLVADPEYAQRLANALRKQWLKDYVPHNADGQVSRAAGRFALVAAAGELAITYNILPWPPGEAAKSAHVCFQAWLNRRGGVEANEITEGMAQVRSFLEKHGSSRFETFATKKEQSSVNGLPHVIPFNPEPQRINNQAGYRELDERGCWIYYVTPEVWKREVCEGFDAGAIAKAMLAGGMMIKDADPRRNTKTIRVPGRGALRVYAISSHFLSNGAE
jgi:putative DNA primase/helicase